jgi:hypothetical protein
MIVVKRKTGSEIDINFGYRYKNPSVKLKFLFFDWMIVTHINLQLSFLPFNKFKSKKLGGAVGSCTYIIILSKVVFAFACYSCPYHTKMNKSLVPE